MAIWAGTGRYNQFSIGGQSYVIQHFMFFLLFGRGIRREALLRVDGGCRQAVGGGGRKSSPQ